VLLIIYFSLFHLNKLVNLQQAEFEQNEGHGVPGVGELMLAAFPLTVSFNDTIT
jgi:hypothetical protein